AAGRGTASPGGARRALRAAAGGDAAARRDARRPRGFSLRGPRLAVLAADRAGVDGRPRARDRLEEELVASHFDQHEGVVLVEIGGRQARGVRVAPPQLAARAGDEVGDALLRLDALVDVVVPREDDVDAVLDEQRLERDAERHVGPVTAGVRVERMVEVADLPVLARAP